MALFQANSGFRNRVYRGVDSCLPWYGAGCDVPPTQPHPAQSMNAVQDQIFCHASRICSSHLHDSNTHTMRRFGSVKSNAFFPAHPIIAIDTPVFAKRVQCIFPSLKETTQLLCSCIYYFLYSVELNQPLKPRTS